MVALNCEIHQVFVKSLDGKHRALNFDTPFVTVSALKHRIQTLTSIPSHLQLLLLSNNNSRILHDDEQSPVNLTSPDGLGFPLVVGLSLRLRGGKGGFGSLLRGAATKAGQKKTNNFDACRDMSGRRLRHVNAEKKLEEWRAEAEERRLEKMAEEFLKKNAKDVAKTGKRNGSDSSDKYVAKYREQSAKCMEDVEKSVRESLKEVISRSSKRRKVNSVATNHSDSKRLKIWLGKRTFNESDSDDSDEDGEPEEREDNTSVIIDNNGSQSDSSKEADRSSCSITGRVLKNGSRDQGSSESGPEEEEIVVEKSLTSEEEEIVVKSISADNLEENIDHGRTDSDSKKEVVIDQPPGDSASELDVAPCAELNSSFQPEAVQVESVSTGVEALDLDKPLNFDEYHSAAELEVLGIERLKMELQSRGLKCGGTLSERAARLFLLKATPLDMLPKKLFVKK